MSHAILLPVVALAAWTFVMWTWMFALRLPAIARAKMALDSNAPNGEQMATLPASIRWKADNYNHLHEQPQVFYAVAIVLFLIGHGGGHLEVGLAWAYVGFRVIHSLVQSLGNHIPTRFAVYLFASLALAALVVRALWAMI